MLKWISQRVLLFLFFHNIWFLRYVDSIFMYWKVPKSRYNVFLSYIIRIVFLDLSPHLILSDRHSNQCWYSPTLPCLVLYYTGANTLYIEIPLSTISISLSGSSVRNQHHIKNTLTMTETDVLEILHVEWSLYEIFKREFVFISLCNLPS